MFGSMMSYAILALFIVGIVVLIMGMSKEKKDKDSMGAASKSSKNMTMVGWVLTILGAIGLVYLWYESKGGSSTPTEYYF